MNATTIPCKRPKVTVEPREDSDTYVVRCHVPGCAYQYPEDLRFHALKSDADGRASMHRQAHRAAVPRTHIFKPTIDRPGYSGCCYECMWDTPAGVSTRADAEASIDSHCSSAHGLVSC